ncbi:heme lyase NrfEFG subunit NrfF [Rodentibacter trehalosifermentans]|uniref:Formate-dependent nitrite reductase complex subunit n=1 Tax=Rodentibacter trehalosifermentans TaxID=1908263 RepID=A0A1V3J4G5_9PAST|nr:heme lyase NrfEFG subunit NrfF [Rodentibacter trehalosifermentans]OOF46474.1 nitrite reductase [Rodentibacter trehalosifermentans]OOF49873.1 nitrite reductase [Rodentibacter trehalosifermentans]OOF52676.1 nitrite reductase [Rodentibacter trehalosifermentans]
MRTFLTALLFCFSLFAQAEMVDTYQFKTSADRTRAVELAKSLRCPQCQNQNLVESNSPIAYDLRIEVYNMVNEGKTNQQIIDTMTARFGDFVNYKPPFQWNTALLWLLPIGLFLLAAGLVWSSQQKTAQLKGRPPSSALNSVEQNEPDTLAPQKPNGKIILSILALVIAIPLGYYLSLDRFSRLQAGEQAMIAQHNKQIEMADFHKREDMVTKIQDKLRTDPNNTEAWIQLGEAYVQNNEFDYALIAYANAEKLVGSQPHILGLKATALYYQAGQQLTPEAKQLLNQALSQDPKEIASLSLLATLALEVRDYTQAKDYLQQLLDSGNAAVDRRMVIQRMKMLEFLDRGQAQ